MVLIDHYAENKTAQTLDDEEYEKETLITTEVCEWTTFCNYIAKQPKQDMASQLKNLVTTDMLKTMFPHFLAMQCVYDNSSWDSNS